MKKWLICISFGLCLISLVIAFFVPEDIWQALFINLSSGFATVGFGLIIVNIYLERSTRKGAVKSLLILSNDSIAGFHNLWLDLVWAKFGRDEYGNIAKEFVSAQGTPEALRLPVRQDIYGIVNGNTTLYSTIDKLEETFTELSRLAGWDLDPKLLQFSLNTRIAIGRLKSMTMDGTPASIDKTTKHILDIDIQCQRARDILMKLADIEE